MSFALSEAQVSATKQASLRALRDFHQENRTLSLQESQLIDRMLDDYKTSREAMTRLSQKLEIMASDRFSNDEAPLIAIVAAQGNSQALDLTSLVKCLEQDRIPLNQKLDNLCKSLNIAARR